ncbi:MAG: Hpt domain-containing protein [Gammaproteobacteria bacterium]|nr:Hpt domain-containing protein [Gammaproteobacteria bacterium]
MNKEALELLNQFRNEFVSELSSKLDDLENMIIDSTSNDQYEEIYRNIHSLKGAGGTHGLHIISIICHQFEEELESQHGKNEFGQKKSTDNLLGYIDLLRQSRSEILQSKTEFSKIESALNSLNTQYLPDYKDILIIESSRLVMELTKQALASLPVNIHSHNNGLTALELLLHKKYDIIITGMEVKGLNGEALIAALKLSRGLSHKCKTILITSKKDIKIKRDLDPDRVIKRDTNYDSNLIQAVTELSQ